MSLTQKVAVVTGAGSGIGRSIVLRLAGLGMRVVVMDVNKSAAERVLAEIPAPQRACAVAVDVSDTQAVTDLFYRVHLKHGGLHYLVNNAGVLGGSRFPGGAVSAWQRAIQVNLIGTLNCIHAAVPHIRESGGGAVVNMASTSGLTPNPLDPVYAASKAGIVNLTRSLGFLAEEDGIRVNCVCPALVRTPLEKHCADGYGEVERRAFLERRAGRIDRPALDPDEVAACAVELMLDETRTGYTCKLVAGQAAELLASPAPQRL